MPCDHVGPPELIEMAEKHLRELGVAEDAWAGRCFRYSENLEGGMWVSVVTEIERRDRDWIVTRLDRSHEPVAKNGFEEVFNYAGC